MRLAYLVAAFLTIIAAPVPAADDAPPFPGKVPVTGIEFPVVTRHEGLFNGKAIAYTATVSEIEVADAGGAPGALIVSTAYVADITPGTPPRPVIFFWNGGPISPSVYLHMGAFGPKRVAFADDLDADPAQAPLVDNPHSLLDVADLVYFDPAGTGLSRAASGKDLEAYFTIEADAQQTAAFIVAWLEHNGRRGSETWVFGESYGTNRAVEVAGQLAALPEPLYLDGVVLFGQAVNIIEYAQRPLNIISFVVSLPTLAAIGWHHGKADTAGMEFDAFVEAAWDYAHGEYLDALFLGNALPPERLRAVAERLEDFTGLRAEVFVEQRLRVSKELYRRELFGPEGLIIGRADGRYVGPLRPDGAEEDAPPPDPSGVLPARLAEAFVGYLVSDLGLPSAAQYVTASPVRGLGEWGWKGTSPFSRFDYGASLTALLEAHPDTRVLVSAGHHDTMTTTGASRYLVMQAPWPQERVSLAFYRGGHMAYSIEDSVRRMAQDLRALVTAP